MSKVLPITFIENFSGLDDPRKRTKNKRYDLGAILVLVILAVVCGADNWVEIETFGKARRAFLKERFGMKSVPSHDTLGDIFVLATIVN